MALTKQPVNINFGKGLDTKSDPYQVPLGNFLDLENGVFDKRGRLTKRNGYAPLGSLPDSTSTFLTTFNENLTAVGDRLFAYSQGSMTWIDKGPLRSVGLTVLPLVRNSLSQVQGDTVIAPNGWACTAYTQIGDGDTSYNYVISDSETGQNIKAPTVIENAAGSCKTFLLGNYFIIVHMALVAAVPQIRFVAINAKTGVEVSNALISNQLSPSSAAPFDAVVANNQLFVAWNGSDLGGAVRMTKVNSSLTVFSPVIKTGYNATIVSVAADTSGAAPVIYTSSYYSSGGVGKIFAVDQNLQTVLAPTDIAPAGVWINLTSSADNGVCTLFYEVINTYPISGERSDYIAKKSVTVAGVVGTASTIVRSVGLASKVFEYGDKQYFLTTYGSDYQPTYFLVDEDGNVLAKVAYSNGGGYVTAGSLPCVNLDGNVASIAYLRRNRLQAVNKSQGAANVAGIFAQTGVNLAKFEIGTSDLGAAEIGRDLHLTGGFVWSYDGVTPVEHGFHLWPDDLIGVASGDDGGMTGQQYYYVACYEWADNQGNLFRSAPSVPVGVLAEAGSPYSTTSIFSQGDTTLEVLDASGLYAGQVLTDSTTPGNLAVGTKITVVDYIGNTIVIDTPTLGSSAGSPGDTLQTVMTCSVELEIPTLRLTYKIDNPVQIVIYRWSTAQQVYYQITSITEPLLNDTTADSVSYTDTQPDSEILGNNILYTTGGVVENIAAPAACAMTLFKTRLIVLDAEDRNQLLYSKQVLPGTPAEMSDLFTINVSPTVSAQGSTGAVKTLAAMDDKLILFKANAIYYMVGTGPDNTGANNDFSEPIFITSTVGCVNQQSIVFVPNGLMFQSDKGIWLLGRDLSTSYIGAPVEDYTISATVESAANIPGTNQVRFTLDSGYTLMYDYYFEQWGTFTNVPAVSSTVYAGLHTYLDNLGRVFQETPGAYLDRSTPVLMKFTTSWINVAGLQAYQRAYEFYLAGTYLSPHKLNMTIAYDYNSAPRQQDLFTPDNVPSNWGSEPLWGSGEVWGGNETPLEQFRVFLVNQKCQSFQITCQEVFDSSYGTVAGAGLTLSGINMTIGIKKGQPNIAARRGA